MLRFKILASTVPLLLAALFAGHGVSSAPQPCIAAGDVSVRLASSPWLAEQRVSFTDQADDASVRVQIVDDATLADFVMIDGDNELSDHDGDCTAGALVRSVAIVSAEHRNSDVPRIYLSRDGGADHRIFVRSATMTARDAAALIVGARGTRAHVTAAL